MRSLCRRQRPKALVAVALIFLIAAYAYPPHPVAQRVIKSVLSAALSGGRPAYAEATDPAASAAAFTKASQVLFNPRCVNCHPAGASPLVGDKSLPHPMHVVRGTEGLGKNGVWCSTCHQEKNLADPRMPPGTPGWQLPPQDMPMVFEKKTTGELCRQMKDPAQNGGRSPEEVVEHVRDAPWSSGVGSRGKAGRPCPCRTRNLSRP